MIHRFRLLIIPAMGLLGLAFIANLIIDTPYIHQLVRRSLNEQLQSQSNLTVDFKALSLSFLPLGIEVYGVELDTADSDTDIASASRVELRLSWTAFFLGRMSLSLVKLHELQFAYPLPREVNLSSSTSPPATASPPQESRSGISWPPEFRLPIEELVLIDSTFRLRLPTDLTRQESLQLSLEGLNVHWTGDNWQIWQMQVASGRTNLSLAQRHVLKDAAIQIDLEANDNQITADNLLIESENLDVGGNLGIELEIRRRKFNPLLSRLFNSEIIGFRLENRLQIQRADLDILGDFLNTEDSDGSILGETFLALHIPLDDRPLDWGLHGDVRSRRARLAGFKLLDSRLRFLINQNGFHFEDIQVEDNGQTLASGHGKIGFSPGTPFQFEITPQGLPFQKLMSILKVDDFQAFDSQLAARNLKLTGQASPFAMDLTGTAHFRNMTVPGLNHQKPGPFAKGPTCTMNMQLAIDQRQLRFQNTKGFCTSDYSVKRLLTPNSRPFKEFSPLELSGDIYFDAQQGLDMGIQLPAADARLLQHFTGFPMQGMATLKSRIHGSYQNIQVDFAADFKPLWIFNQPFESFTLHGQYESQPRRLTLHEAQLLDPQSGQVSLTGGIFHFAQHIVYQGPLSVEGLSGQTMKKITDFYAPDLGLNLVIRKIKGNIDGPLDNLSELGGQVDYSLENIKFQGENIASVLEGSLHKAKRQYQIKDGFFRLDLFEMNYNIDHRPASRYQPASSTLFQFLKIGKTDPLVIKLKSKELPQNSQQPTVSKPNNLNHLASLPYIGDILTQSHIGGDLTLDATLEGTLNHLEGQIQGSVQNVFVLNSPLASIYFSGFLDGTKLNVPVLKHAGNALVGRLSIDFGQQGIPYEWYFDLKQFDFRPLLGPTFASDPRNFAYLSASWNMKGQFQDWWNSRGQLAIKNIDLTYLTENLNQTQKIELVSSQNITIDFSKTGWNFAEGKNLKLDGQSFSLEVQAENNNPPEDINVSMEATIDLEVLKRVFPQIETAQGQLLVDGSVTGSLADPNIVFNMRERKLNPFERDKWEPVSVGLADFPPAFTNIKLDAAYENGIVKVNRLSANKGKQGAVIVSGQLDLSDPNGVDSRLLLEIDQAEFNRVEVPLFNNANITMSGSLNLTGNQFPLQLAGQIRLDRAQSVGNFDLRKQIIQTLYKKKYTAPLDRREPILNLDVSVDSDRSIYIKNRNIEATLSAGLRIQGTEIDPIVLGQITTEQGTFVYKRTFDITRGIISFEEPTSPPDPKIDVIGRTQVETYNVEVIISGTASEPKVSFNIDPPNRPDGTPISKVDIIVLLTSGQLPSNTSASPIRVASNEALSLFVGFAEGPLEKIFDSSGQTFVRQVYIDSYLSETENRPVTRLNLPITINNNLRLVFQVDDEGNFRPSFQYALHENISVSGSIDKQQDDAKSRSERNLSADTVVDLKFRFKFE